MHMKDVLAVIMGEARDPPFPLTKYRAKPAVPWRQVQAHRHPISNCLHWDIRKILSSPSSTRRRCTATSSRPTRSIRSPKASCSCWRPADHG